MLDINQLRSIEPRIITIGSHPGIIQSILDFDYLTGKKTPTVVGIIASGRRFERYFFGKNERLIPVFRDEAVLSEQMRIGINMFLNLSSARRTLSSTVSLIEALPNITLGTVFAENVAEQHSLTLGQILTEKNISVFGPASVGLLIPNVLKLGAIGGVDIRQLAEAQIRTPGSVAVFSASGGMTNELINIVTRAGKRISFALSFGGDRFPLFTPKDAFLAAQEDMQTEMIVYYGELGGVDEYELVELIKNGTVTKPVYCYIGGTVSDLFAEAPQFGHAKAMAKSHDETAQAKREALRSVGVKAASSFAEFVESINAAAVLHNHEDFDYTTHMDETEKRQKALIMSSISNDDNGVVKVLGEDLLAFSKDNSFAAIVTAMFMGKKAKAEETISFIDFVLRLLVDHGPHVSGAVNTIVTSRAGRDLVSSLAAGLLTVGPRFGGAINEAAANWLSGATEGVDPDTFVENFAAKKKYILGIGHRKYRSDNPDPRVQALLESTHALEKKRFTNFATAVERVTVAKKGNLILNVDGTIAAVLLDLLSEKEGYTDEELKRLTEIEFFNALFVLSRSVGFIAHFLDQKRLDEGLFRLEEHHVVSVHSQEEE
jgi:ATP citrate (pro-S)-lyase